MVLLIFQQTILRSLIILCALLPQLALSNESFEVVNARRAGLIEGAIQFNPHLRHSAIKVAVRGSVVLLTGTTDSSVAKSLAEQLVLNVRGVEKVQNQLLVIEPTTMGSTEQRSQVPAVDSRLSNVTISNKVKSQLLANRQTSGMNIDVETDNRVVTITGQVTSQSERELAYWVVRNTQGVKQVVDRLDVEDSDSRQLSIRATE